MRLERKLFVALGASLVAGACATAGTGTGPAAGAFPVVVCADSVTPRPSAQAVEAQKALLLGRTDEALTAVQAAVAADPANPQHQFLLGQVQAAGGDLQAADVAWDAAVASCAAFAAEIDPERERAWASSFQAGLEAYQQGDTATALARWQAANLIDTRRPDAYYNLGVVYAQRGELPRAVESYREALSILERMPADTAAAEIAARAETRQNTLAGLLSIGAQQFQAEDYTASADLFEWLTGLDPNNRDAWYNRALALYKLEQWEELVPVAQRLVQIDPLNENARIILFNAYKGQAEAAPAGPQEQQLRNQALAALQEVESLPVYVDELRFNIPEGGPATMTGKVVGNAARAGQQVTLQFTFYGPAGQVGTETVTVAAPAKGEATSFQVPLPAGPVTSFSYRVQ